MHNKDCQYKHTQWTSTVTLFLKGFTVCETLSSQRTKRQVDTFFIMQSPPYPFLLIASASKVKTGTKIRIISEIRKKMAKNFLSLYE